MMPHSITVQGTAPVLSFAYAACMCLALTVALDQSAACVAHSCEVAMCALLPHSDYG